MEDILKSPRLHQVLIHKKFENKNSFQYKSNRVHRYKLAGIYSFLYTSIKGTIVLLENVIL